MNQQTHVALADLAELYNPVILGWWNYYGAFYGTAMHRIFLHIDRALERWARCKFKVLHGRRRRSAEWLKKMQRATPLLFRPGQVTGPTAG